MWLAQILNQPSSSNRHELLLFVTSVCPANAVCLQSHGFIDAPFRFYLFPFNQDYFNCKALLVKAKVINGSLLSMAVLWKLRIIINSTFRRSLSLSRVIEERGFRDVFHMSNEITADLDAGSKVAFPVFCTSRLG